MFAPRYRAQQMGKGMIGAGFIAGAGRFSSRIGNSRYRNPSAFRIPLSATLNAIMPGLSKPQAPVPSSFPSQKAQEQVKALVESVVANEKADIAAVTAAEKRVKKPIVHRQHPPPIVGSGGKPMSAGEKAKARMAVMTK